MKRRKNAPKSKLNRIYPIHGLTARSVRKNPDKADRFEWLLIIIVLIYVFCK